MAVRRMAAGPEGRGLEEEKIGARVGGVECVGWGVSERTGEGSRVVGILSGSKGAVVGSRTDVIVITSLPQDCRRAGVG